MTPQTFDSTLNGSNRTEWEFPELRQFPTYSAAWYRRWRELHLAKYPNVDRATRDNLDLFVDLAEKREAT